MYRKMSYLIPFVVLLASATVQADLKLVENFEGMAAGSPDGQACTGVMGGTWDTQSEGTGSITIVDIGGSRVVNIIGDSAGTSVRAIGFNGITNTIDNSETGKVFLRFMIRSYSLVPRSYAGLISDTSDDPINSTSADAPTSIPAGFGLLDNGSGGLNLVKTDGTTVLNAGLVRAQWYNVWIVANNEKDTFDLYLSTAEGPAGEATLPKPEDLVAGGIAFGVATAEPLTGMIFNNPAGTGQAERFYIDEIYWDGDQGLGAPTKARNPSPAHQDTDVPRDVSLSWTPGPFAATHDVYFGTVFNNVQDASRTNPLGVLASFGQTANTYDPAGVLDFGQTYYWRVDEVNAPPDSTIFKGNIWQFTVEPIAYPVAGGNITATASSSNTAGEGPGNTINGSGLNAGDLHSAENTAMWLSSVIGTQPTWIMYELDQVYKLHQMLVWNYNTSIEPVIGFGIKQATIEYSTDGANWTTLGTAHEFARGSGAAGLPPNTTVDLSGVAAKYIKITANSNWGGVINQYGLSEVRLLYMPVWAREFNPASGTIDMDVDNVAISWRAGREAAKHNLYFSTDQQAVINETISPVSIPSDRSYVSYDIGAIELAQTYYWKVDEVNEAETPTTWQGDVLSFTTREFLIVDDFEDYNDFEPDRIFDTWIDGWNVPTNGSQVGYAEPPFTEQSIIHGGRQSMPFAYDNSAGAVFSEAVRTFAAPQDWTKHGIKTLVLYFHGNPTNSGGQLYVKLNDYKVVYGGDTAAMAKLRWQQWNIDLASVGVNLKNITKLSIGVDGNGAKGTLYFDDIQLYRLAPEVVVSSEELWLEAEAATTITEPMMIVDDPAASGGKYIGTDPSLTNSNNNPPAPAGTATYTFTVAGGVYKLQFRVNIPSGDDSLWVRIPGATTQTANHSSGWVMFNGIEPGNFWHWDDVFSDDDPGNPTVQFTMPAGTYTLEIGYREAGAMLDVIVISKID